MDVTVGIVSWQTAELLDRCLTALPGATGSLAAEVVVVDNASTDGSADVARRHGARVIANAENVGYARAMNQALAGADSPFLIALNPDTVARPGSLERLVTVLRAEPTVGLAVPRLLNPDGSLQPSVHRFPSIRTALVMGLVPLPIRRGPIGASFWLEGYAPHDRKQPVDWAIGAAHAIRRSALPDPDHVYRERTFMYAEDMDLCWLLRRDGWMVVLEPAAEIAHVGNAAAAQRFGGRVDDMRVAADHDWYVERHGVGPARLWSLANTLAFGVKTAITRTKWGVADPRARRLEHFFRLHARNAGLSSR